MPSYRLYRLDGAGKITAADWIEARDDQDAVRQAGLQPPATRYELWDRQRLVARIDGPGRGGAPGD